VDIRKPHDALFRFAFEDERSAAILLRGLLERDPRTRLLAGVIDWSRLKRIDRPFSDAADQPFAVDLWYAAPIGDDVVATLPRWREVTRLLSMVQLVVLQRADHGRETAELAVMLERVGAGMARRLAARRVDVSSTEIRARVRDGRSIRGFVPDTVATYIATTGLYLENSRESSTTEGPARA
jgi:hypothetical protein